jgi:hypothetical protein
MKAFFITLTIVIGVCVCVNIQAQKGSPKEVVYQMCQSSRMTDSVAEQTCADLQDHYNIEFLCEQNNKSSSNHCWVEEK